MYVGYSVVEVEWYVVVIEALYDVAWESACIGEDFDYTLDVGSFEFEASCHDEADIS